MKKSVKERYANALKCAYCELNSIINGEGYTEEYKKRAAKTLAGTRLILARLLTGATIEDNGRFVALTENDYFDNDVFEETVELVHCSDFHQILCPFVEQADLDDGDSPMAIVFYIK